MIVNTVKKVLVGNVFPFALILADVNIRVVSIEVVREALAGAEIFSFWGHNATQIAAEKLLGVSLQPRTNRPALELSPEGLPSLYDEVFNVCWVCAPNYRSGFRPLIGQEVAAEDILGWHTLRMNWVH